MRYDVRLIRIDEVILDK